MKDLPAVHEWVFGLQQVGETVELLKPRIGVMFAMRGMTGHLHDDGVFGHVLAVVRAECHPGDPGAEESASRLVLAPARQLSLSKQAFVLRGLFGTDMDDNDVQLTHNRSSSTTSSDVRQVLPSILDACAARRRGARCLILARAGAWNP